MGPTCHCLSRGTQLRGDREGGRNQTPAKDGLTAAGGVGRGGLGSSRADAMAGGDPEPPSSSRLGLGWRRGTGFPRVGKAGSPEPKNRREENLGPERRGDPPEVTQRIRRRWPKESGSEVKLPKDRARSLCHWTASHPAWHVAYVGGLGSPSLASMKTHGGGLANPTLQWQENSAHSWGSRIRAKDDLSTLSKGGGARPAGPEPSLQLQWPAAAGPPGPADLPWAKVPGTLFPPPVKGGLCGPPSGAVPAGKPKMDVKGV